MGYAPATAKRALAAAKGSVEAAVAALDPGFCGAETTGNANHLLRFTTAAPQREPPRRRAPAKPRRAHRPRGIAFEAPAVRLLVAAGVASPFACDADTAPPWEGVVAADVVADAVACPICLEDAARVPVMTRCGHCFCAACIVRHCSGDAVRSKRCPCCAAPLGVRDLRPAFLQAPASELVLLARPRSARRACVEGAVSSNLPVSSDRCDLLSKLTEATPAAAASAMRAFRAALAAASDAANDELERRDVAAAVAWLGNMEPAASPSPPLAAEGDGKIYRFYGRRDGSLVFLHPLSLKLLTAAVGCVDDLPRALAVKVAHTERFEQSPTTRKRFPWLAHVALGSDITLLDARGDAGFGAEFTERCQAVRDPALRDALAARSKATRAEREKSDRAERRHTHTVEKRLAAAAPVRAAPFVSREGDFVPMEENEAAAAAAAARAKAALGAAPTAMSFANKVARNFAAPVDSFPELSASPPRAWGGGGAAAAAAVAAPPPRVPRTAEPAAEPAAATPWGGRGAAAAPAEGPWPRAAEPEAAGAAWGDRGGVAAKGPKKTKKTLSLTGGGRRY